MFERPEPCAPPQLAAIQLARYTARARQRSAMLLLNGDNHRVSLSSAASVNMDIFLCINTNSLYRAAALLLRDFAAKCVY